MGARDFAGGLVVHINAGVAALACVMVLGVRGAALPRLNKLWPLVCSD
jgi:ammonia channel protein AmtB